MSKNHEYFDFPILDIAVRLGIKITGNSGDECTAKCPLCGDKADSHRGHLYLNVRTNQYYCHLCGNGGSSLKLYASCRGLEYKEAYKELMNDLYIKPVNYSSKVTTVNTNQETTAPLEERDKVYNAMLDMLVLEKQHIQNLKKRGLELKDIAELKYRSVPTDEKRVMEICSKLSKQYNLKDITGFYTDGGKWVFNCPSGIFIPVRDVDGRIKGLQVRVDEPGDKGKYRWFSSNGKENGTKAKSWAHITKNRSGTVVITEGPLKADIAAKLSGAAFIGLPGVNAVKELETALQKLKLPKNSVIYIAYDMDKKKNVQVLNAEKKVAEIVAKMGLKSEILEWDYRQGKGIDDYLMGISTNERQGLFVKRRQQQTSAVY